MSILNRRAKWGKSLFFAVFSHMAAASREG